MLDVECRNDNTDYGMPEETLWESEEKYRTIFERANDAIILLDKSGRILNVNRKGAVLFGGLKKEPYFISLSRQAQKIGEE